MSKSKAANPVEGVLWMMASGLAFVLMAVVVRAIGPDVNAVVGGFIRYLWSVVFLLPSLWVVARLRLSAPVWGMVGGRGIVQALGIALWFYAIARLPVAEVTAIGYLNPVLVTLGGALFFGERLTLTRVLAVLIAIIGALIVLRPGLRALDLAHLAQIGTAFALASSYLLAKKLSDYLPPAAIVSLMSLSTALVMAPFAILMWQPVTLMQVLMFGVVAIFATSGHYFMMRAFAAAPIMVTQPVTFLQLIWATILGLLLFGESVDPFVIAGGALIIAAICVNTWREAQQRKRATALT